MSEFSLTVCMQDKMEGVMYVRNVRLEEFKYECKSERRDSTGICQVKR